MFTVEEGTNTFPRAEKHTLLALFPLFRSLTKREKGEEEEGQREESVFSSFFFALLFHNAFIALSLFFLSLPLFSLSFLSLSSSFRVCVFARILSTQIYLFGGGSQSHPIIVVLIFPRYKSKQQQQHAKRAFYSVNARNKNRDTHTHALKQKARERTVRRTIFDFYIIKW